MVYSIKNGDATFAADIGSWLGCKRELDTHFRDSILYQKIPIEWSELDLGPLQFIVGERSLVDLIKKADATFAVMGIGGWFRMNLRV